MSVRTEPSYYAYAFAEEPEVLPDRLALILANDELEFDELEPPLMERPVTLSEKLFARLPSVHWRKLKKLTHAELLVLIVLAFHANRAKDNEAFPSRKRIAALTSYSPSTVAHALRRLRTLKLIRRVKGGWRGLTTIWEVCPESREASEKECSS